jgi:hypothetical protein
VARDLEDKVGILQNLGLVVEATFNSVKRSNITEEFADFLTAGQ